MNNNELERAFYGTTLAEKQVLDEAEQRKRYGGRTAEEAEQEVECLLESLAAYGQDKDIVGVGAVISDNGLVNFCNDRMKKKEQSLFQPDTPYHKTERAKHYLLDDRIAEFKQMNPEDEYFLLRESFMIDGRTETEWQEYVALTPNLLKIYVEFVKDRQ